MEDLAGLFGRMVILGVAIAAPVGAMGILCIERTLARGWRAGFATGAGIATADALFAALAAFGLTAVSEWLVRWQGPLRIIGGIALLWIGWRALKVPSPVAGEVAPSSPNPEPADRSSLGGLYLSAAGLTLTNPLTIIAFAAVFAGAGIVAQPGLPNAMTATVGIAVGSLLWWLVLVTGTSAVRHALSPRAILIVNRVSGGLLIAFGVLATTTGVMSLL